MSKSLSMLFALASMTAPAFGALPPLYQTQKEIKSILNVHDLGQYLPDGEPIMEIRKSGQGYEILTTRHQVQVDVVYLPLQRPGPAQFRLEFQQAQPIDNH